MGTRNLTVVIKDGARKVAQYGQWDGYPEGQGQIILAFLSDPTNVTALRVVVDKVRFLSPEDVKDILALEVPDLASKDWVTTEEAARLDAVLPSMSRDVCGHILEQLVSSDNPRSLLLKDSFSFGKDSLFCEWAYVVDLDKDVLEVYTGFQKEIHSEGRWASGVLNREGYAPIRKVIEFRLGNLPDLDSFLTQINARIPQDAA